MKLVKVIVIIAVIIVIIAIVFICGVFVYIHKQLGSAEFKQKVVRATEQAIGSEVKIANLQVSLFKGLTLQDVSIANPPGFEGDFFAVNDFLFEYELWPLLRKQFHIKEVSLRAPVIMLRQNPEGVWNYEVLIAAHNTDKIEERLQENETESLPFDIVVSHLGVQEGTVRMIEPDEKLLLEIRGFNISSAVEVENESFHGDGNMEVQSVNIPEMLLIENIVSPITVTENELRLDGFSCNLADGIFTGSAIVTLKEPSYEVDIKLLGSKMDKLFEQANTKQVISGELKVVAKFRGAAGIESIVGDGYAEIQSGQLLNLPLLNFLAGILQIHELQDIRFDECRVEFSIANNILHTPVITLKSPSVALSGRGTFTLSDLILNHDMTLKLRNASLQHAPKEIRSLFITEPDDWAALHFRVWGPHDSPETDLKSRIVKGTAQKLLEKGLNKLF